jgi:hypothetical protein
MGWDFVMSGSATCSGNPPEAYHKVRIGSQRIDDILLDKMYSDRDEHSAYIKIPPWPPQRVALNLTIKCFSSHLLARRGLDCRTLTRCTTANRVL